MNFKIYHESVELCTVHCKFVFSQFRRQSKFRETCQVLNKHCEMRYGMMFKELRINISASNKMIRNGGNCSDHQTALKITSEIYK